MKIHVISCQIFEPYINELQKRKEINSDFSFTYEEIDSHNEPNHLRSILQSKIDEITHVDMIILLYGICGNATKGIKANTIPVLIPKVHDCTTILLGGKDQYRKHFGHRPSQGWNSIAYQKNEFHNVPIETHPTYLEFKEKYGEDNALYLMETMYPVSEDNVYISLNLREDHEHIKLLDSKTEIIYGDIQCLLDILHADSAELLVLHENETIVPLYDQIKVMTKK